MESYAPRDYSIIPPSPEAGTLLKYSEIPVNYYNGLPDISFELFQLTEGSLTVPITLSYHGGGIQVTEKEGNAGLGWVVTSGANISRTVSGAPDEASGGSTQIHGLFKLNNDEKEFRKRLIEQVADFDPSNGAEYADKRSWMAILGRRYYEGLTDVANDVFQISGLGLSGTFIYNDKQKIVLSSESPVDIEPKQCQSYYPNTFIAKSNNGTTYTFGTTEQTRYTYFHGAPELTQIEDSIKYVSTWHISSISDACGNEIKFIYDENPGYEWKTSFSEAVAEVSNKDLSAYTPQSVSSINTVIYHPRLLKKIQSSGVTVDFEYDILKVGSFYKKLIKAINVTTKNSQTPTKRFEFIYSDIENVAYENTSDGFFSTWKVLSEVRENKKSIYRFDYNTDTEHNFIKASQARDFGGYYNGKDNFSLVPSFANYSGRFANRSVDPNAAIISSLKTIYHPTGGTTTIEWESNDFGYIKDSSLKHQINDAVVSQTEKDTLRMCYDNAFKKLKLTNYQVGKGHEIKLDLTQYFLMNPANLMTTDYEISHEFEAEHYNSIFPPDYPHVTIRKSANKELVAVYFIDKNTIEKKFLNEPIYLPLEEGSYDFELINPTSVSGAEDLLEAEFRYGDSIAGKIYIIKNCYEANGGAGEFIGKDFWCGLRVRRIISQSDNDEEPLIKDFIYNAAADPNISDGTVQMLPRYNHSYYMVCPSPNVPGEEDTEVIIISSAAFPGTPKGSVHQIQYPIVTTRMSKQDRYEPNDYLHQQVEHYLYSSCKETGYADYNLTEFMDYQPVGSRMLTSMGHKRGNLLSKKTGGFGYGLATQNLSYTYNIFEPSELDIFTTEAFTICDFSHYPGINGHYGSKAYSIGKYHLIPFNKTVATETLTEESGFSTTKTYQYFYNEYTDKSDYNLVKSTSFINSEGEEEKTYYTYLKIGINYSSFVETEVRTCGNKIVSATRNEYDPSTLLLKKKYTLKENPSNLNQLLSTNQETTAEQKRLISKPEYEYLYNSKGNVVQISFNGIILASYLWGYCGHHPIMEAQGISINNLLSVASAAGFSQEAILSGEPYTESQVKSLAQVVRAGFPDANVTTMTYHWLIGVMESTDSRGVSTTFNYDRLGRLTEIRDLNNLLITKHSYHNVWEGPEQ